MGAMARMGITELTVDLALLLTLPEKHQSRVPMARIAALQATQGRSWYGILHGEAAWSGSRRKSSPRQTHVEDQA